jgi:Zn-dependent peptidase ImmA (M78 family)/transcriptional regulator with XRE-family HTH domain
MAIDLVTIGQRLKAARTNRGLTQEDAARELGVQRGVLVAFEGGERPLSMDELNEFSRVYGRPVHDLIEERAEDVLVALLRATPEIQSEGLVEQEIMRHMGICRDGAELEALLGITRRPGPPTYDLASPSDVAEAMEQGGFVARQERQRLGLGDNPISDMADLLTAAGIWASGSRFPDEMSGLFLRHPSIGMVILVNFNHARARKRFSYAHEYAHALLDRSDTATISTHRNRTELREVRANAFAAAFLLPAYGVRRFLTNRGKGLPSRLETVVYDPGIEDQDKPVRAMHRPIPGSQKVGYQDVATLAHAYRTSYQAAAYRLKALNVLNERELKGCLQKKEAGWEYLQTLDLLEDIEGIEEPKRADRELVIQVAELAIEAFRRGQYEPDQLLELGARVGLGAQKLLTLAKAAL